MPLSPKVKEEIVFFAIGILPYWYTLWLPEKSLSYWSVLVWACGVWIVYGYRRGASMTILNNVVELFIALSGIATMLHGR